MCQGYRPVTSGGILIHHIAFVEALSHFEAQGADSEWRETFAGLLVLRLYRLWQLNPETAGVGAPGARSVHAIVDDLPESASTKTRLMQILDSLGGPAPMRRTVITRLLGDYATGLTQQAQWALAADVYETAGMRRPKAVLANGHASLVEH